MSTVHRVAWRIERPSLVTSDRFIACVMFLASTLYATGVWDPSRGAAICFSAALGFASWQADHEARQEYRTYVRVIKDGAA